LEKWQKRKENIIKRKSLYTYFFLLFSINQVLVATGGIKLTWFGSCKGSAYVLMFPHCPHF